VSYIRLPRHAHVCHGPRTTFWKDQGRARLGSPLLLSSSLSDSGQDDPTARQLLGVDPDVFFRPIQWVEHIRIAAHVDKQACHPRVNCPKDAPRASLSGCRSRCWPASAAPSADPNPDRHPWRRRLRQHFRTRKGKLSFESKKKLRPWDD